MHAVQSKLLASMLKPASASSTVTDRDLIERHLAHDSAAFAELVSRYAPMVLDVCRRVVPNWHDAEDACQAVFIILAKKAGVCRWNASIANWLFATARHVALKASRANGRRSRQESRAKPPIEGTSILDQMSAREVFLALDDELERLPSVYREPLVLCCLVGLSREEASTRLGWKLGSLKARLERGRKRLADALSRRGIAPAAAFLGIGMMSASCPASLLRSTLTAVGGQASNVSARLASDFVAGSKIGNPQFWTAIAIGAVVLGSAAFAWPSPKVATKTGSTDDTVLISFKPLPKEREVREGEILIWRDGTALLLKSDGKQMREWKGADVTVPGGVRLSPDGTTILLLRAYETRTKNLAVAVGGGGKLQGTFSRHLFRITLYPVKEKLQGKDIELPVDSVEAAFWSADGSKIFAATHGDEENYSHEVDLKHYVIDTATLKFSELKLPAGHHLLDVSQDGKLFLTRGPGLKATHAPRACLIPASGGEPVGLSEPNEAVYDAQFSPDGSKVLLTGFRNVAVPLAKPGETGAAPPVAAASEGWLATLPIDDPKKRTNLPLKDREYANQCRWAPDGKRILTARQVLPELNKDAPQKEIVITDADGKNAKVITRNTGKHLDPVVIDWR